MLNYKRLLEDTMIRPLRFALLLGFAISAMTAHASACNVECNAGEAYDDEAELCMPVGSVST